jgi:hypothetical protein
MSLEQHGLSIEGSIEQLRSSTEQRGLNIEQHGLVLKTLVEYRTTRVVF